MKAKSNKISEKFIVSRTIRWSQHHLGEMVQSQEELEKLSMEELITLRDDYAKKQNLAKNQKVK